MKNKARILWLYSGLFILIIDIIPIYAQQQIYNFQQVDSLRFRIISGRKKLPLENWKWFYNLSVSLGKRLLFFVPEVNIILWK